MNDGAIGSFLGKMNWSLTELRQLYIYVDITALLLFFLMLLAFMLLKKNREINAWLLLLGAMVVWSMGSLFVRVDIFPGADFWFYCSLIALVTIMFSVYNYVYMFSRGNGGTNRSVWLIVTIVMMIASVGGAFISPPRIAEAGGYITLSYSLDWRISVPILFFVMVIAATAIEMKSVVNSKGPGAPGVKEIIVGCIIFGIGNLVVILPGNHFPFDTLGGVLFALLLCISLYKRRLFDTDIVISGSILYILSAILLVAAGGYVLPKLVAFLDGLGARLAPAEVEAFIVLAVALILIIYAFRKLLRVLFSDKENRGHVIKKYSDYISKTLDYDSILTETVDIIRSELGVSDMYICLLEEDRYVPVRSSAPYDAESFRISRDNPCVKFLEQGDNHMVLKELQNKTEFGAIQLAERKLFSEYGISCICALKDADSVMGIMLMTEKSDGSDYEYGDFAFMNIVSSIASIAIKNAALYRKVAGRENLLSSMSEFIPNVIFIKHRKDDSFSFVSENTMRVLGLPGEYFDSHKVDEVLLECLGEELTNELNENLVAKADSSFICDTPFTRPDDGNVINIRCAFSPIVLNGKVTHYVCVINDITSDVQAQAMLKTSVELAQNSNKAKSVFMSHMSHEIRTPMNSIAGLTYLARELPVVEENEELRSYLDQIDQSSQYLISILNNIMDMSKIESNKYELHNAEFDIGEVINEVYTVYSSQMSANGIDFELDNSGLVKTRVIGDEISLRKILNNLLSNAFKFTPSGGKVTLTVSQKLKTEKTSAVSIVVRDTGIGMSPEFIEKLFEPYTQERTENASRSAGSGLGMAICKSMIEMQGGTISAESRVGEGSCFTALLPYTLANIAVEEKKPAAADSSRLSGKRIMVVDDVAINTVITKRLLEKQKVLVECAENGQLAFDLYMSKPDYYYDCILMDIQMPVMDGMEAASRIRASGKNCAGSLPIAAMTADNFVSDNHYGDLDAFNDFILKPISPEMLYDKLCSLIEG